MATSARTIFMMEGSFRGHPIARLLPDTSLVELRFANVVTMRTEHIGWNFQVPYQYGLQSIRSHPGSLLLTITATAANAKPVSIQIEARIKADKSGFEAKRA